MGTPASFIADPAASAPASFQPDPAPASFQADDPLDTKATTAAALPSREAFEASHHSAVADWWEKVKAVGEAAGPMLYKKAQELTSIPAVSPGDVGGAVSGALGFGEKPGRDVVTQPPTSVLTGLAKGTAETISGLTSAQNIGLGALMGPVGKIAPLLSRAVSAGFGVQMLKSVVDQSPEVADAVQKKDWPRAAEAITKAALTGGLGVLAGTHAVRGGPEVTPVAETSPIEKATPESFEPDHQATDTGAENLTPPLRINEGVKKSTPLSGETTAPTPPSFVAEQAAPPSFRPEAATTPFAPSSEGPKGEVTAPQPAETAGVQPESATTLPGVTSAPREPATPPAIGRDANVLVPGEATTYPARYAVRELADVQPSHNAFSFEPNPAYEYTNDRDYSRPQNAARVVANAAPDTFNPDYPTTDSPTAEHGAIAPQALRVEGREGWQVTDQLKQGIALAEDARVHKMPVEDAAAQSVIGGERSYSPEAIDIAKTLERGPVNAAKAFRGYANDEALSRPGAQTQFFTAPTRAEAFKDAFGREPASATTLGGGLGAFEPFFRESMDEGRALLAKRRAAMQALDARSGTPEQQKAGEAMRQWFTGERDLWSTRVNQALDRASRMFTPDVKTREAVGIMREFAHRPGELEKFLDGTHPILAGADQATLDRIEALRPAMRQALAPTEKMLKANRVYTNIAQKSLEEGEAGGWLGSRWKSDEYMPHLLHAGADQGEVPAPPADKIQLVGNNGKQFQFAERRYDEYPTMLHAIADGKIPKTMDPADAFAIHGSNFARARATHLFEAQMATAGMGNWGTLDTAPHGWVPLAAHSDEFSRGLQTGGAERLFVPPFIQEALKPLTDPDVRSRAFQAVRGAQRGLKEAILGLSGFHLLTENWMAGWDMGPGGMYKALTTSRDSPEFLQWERDAALHGEPTSIQGRTMDAYRNLAPGSIPTRGEIIRAYIPGAKQGLEVARAITQLTFDNIQRRYKVISYMLHSMAWDRENPGGTAAQRSAARQGIASYVNGVYGGLHWENLGWNKALVETARLLLLAPDWTGSNIALGKYAVDAKPSMQELPFRDKLAGATDKESAQARLSRAFWAKSLAGGLVATQLMSLAVSGHYSKKPFMVYSGKDKDGNEVYWNMAFRGAAGDLVNLAQKMQEHGLLTGVGEFAGGKAAPFVKAGVHVLTGRNDFGREIAPKGLNPVANTARSVGQAVSDVSPIPISLKSIQHTTFGDEADKYTWSERVLSLFGPPPRHMPPEGQKRTAHGLQAVPQQPENSTWQQIITGREHPSTRRSAR